MSLYLFYSWWNVTWTSSWQELEITPVWKCGNWCSMKWQHQSFFLSVVIGGTNRAQYLRLHSPLWPWGDPWEPQHQSRYVVVSHKDTIVTTASWLYSAQIVLQCALKFCYSICRQTHLRMTQKVRLSRHGEHEWVFMSEIYSIDILIQIQIGFRLLFFLDI